MMLSATSYLLPILLAAILPLGSHGLYCRSYGGLYRAKADVTEAVSHCKATEWCIRVQFGNDQYADIRYGCDHIALTDGQPLDCLAEGCETHQLVNARFVFDEIPPEHRNATMLRICCCKHADRCEPDPRVEERVVMSKRLLVATPTKPVRTTAELPATTELPTNDHTETNTLAPERTQDGDENVVDCDKCSQCEVQGNAAAALGTLGLIHLLLPQLVSVLTGFYSSL